ncbi:MAG: hybrid sensor histidine kinase/response regulator [Myxococcota bacterium]
MSGFMPPGLEPSSPEAFRTQAIISTALLVGNSGFPFILLFFFMQHPKEAVVIVWSWLLFMAIPWLAKRAVRPSLLAHLLAANYYQCHLFLCLIWGGIDAPNIMWFAAMPIVSVLVGGIAHGIVWGAVAALSVLSVYLLQFTGVIELTSSLEPGEHLFVVAASAVGLLGAIFGSTAAFESLRIRAIRHRVRAEAQLLSTNQDLMTREQELKQSCKEVEGLLIKVENADKAKSRFLAQVSHELRTPLNGILGTSEAIQEGVYGALTSEQLSALHTMDRAAQHQLALINDLLDLAKIEKGAFEPVLEPVCIFTAADDAVQFLGDKAKQAGVDLEVERCAEPLRIVTDQRRVRQMILNLVGNALKFTPSGGRVSVTLQVRGEWVAIEVRDTGIGIAPEALPRMFEAFTQVDSVLQRGHEGSGLGLSLTANFAKLLGGQLKAESALGKGSTFTVLLPHRVEDDRQESASTLGGDATGAVKAGTVAAGSSANEGLDVLLVDDTETNIIHLRDFLLVKGHRVTTASNGLEAIEQAQARPDVIFMDVQMPEMDGLEAIRRLRAVEHTRDLFIVSLTSFAMHEDRQRCLDAGADDYESKPVSLKRILELVEGRRGRQSHGRS